jgi:hypothetical protein
MIHPLLVLMTDHAASQPMHAPMPSGTTTGRTLRRSAQRRNCGGVAPAPPSYTSPKIMRCFLLTMSPTARATRFGITQNRYRAKAASHPEPLAQDALVERVAGIEQKMHRHASLETIIRNFIAGEYDSALRVVAFNAAEGWSRDVSEDVAAEIIDRAYDADETLTEGTKRSIDRHIEIERRPRAPSVLRDADIVRKKLA